MLKYMTSVFLEKYDVGCCAALHHNKSKTNLHIHLIFSEKEIRQEVERKIASRNMFYNESGKHVRTKKEILDENGNVRPGCKIIKKGEVYETNFFQPKKEEFKTNAFLENMKQVMTDAINGIVKDENEKLQVFQKDSPYLATKKIGKNNPKEAEIKADNYLRQEWNRNVDRALLTGASEAEVMAAKQLQIDVPVAESLREHGQDPRLFTGILQKAIGYLRGFVEFLRETKYCDRDLKGKRNIYSKILEMLQLARIIQSIHERDKAHRDIKPENILVLNGKLVLSDFGLCWGIGEERLTGLNERVGPYKIMPPELERVQTDLDLDFKPSDVYLFSKVLWMTLKGDNIGFRGQYQRGEVQIYLNKEDYDNVITLEPIHKLMEEATFEEMGKRISIQKCIEYLELQRKILNREEYELLSNEFVSQLLYDEYSKKIIACSKPDELTYKDAAIITHMLRDIIPISNIFVKSLHSDQNIKQIQITDFQVGMDGICKLLYYNKGIKIKEYLLNISKMNYSNYSSVISLELNDISLVDEGYIAYSAAGHGFGNEYPRVYFSSGEKIIIKRKENL